MVLAIFAKTAGQLSAGSELHPRERSRLDARVTADLQGTGERTDRYRF